MLPLLAFVLQQPRLALERIASMCACQMFRATRVKTHRSQMRVRTAAPGPAGGRTARAPPEAARRRPRSCTWVHMSNAHTVTHTLAALKTVKTAFLFTCRFFGAEIQGSEIRGSEIPRFRNSEVQKFEIRKFELPNPRVTTQIRELRSPGKNSRFGNSNF